MATADKARGKRSTTARRNEELLSHASSTEEAREDYERLTIADNDMVHKHVRMEDYLEMKHTFEKNHFYDIASNEVVEVHKGRLMYMKMAHATEYLDKNWRFVFDSTDIVKGFVPFFKLWSRDSERRCAWRIARMETNDPDDFFVPFVFAYEAVSTAEVSAGAAASALELFTAIASAAFNDDDDMCAYFYSYLAHMLQRPLDLPGVSIILTGAKGSGKDTLLNFIVKSLLGRAVAVSYDKVESLFNTHDVGSMNKIAIHVEELSERSLKPFAKQLRSLITAEVRTFNNKNGAILHNVQNYSRVLASSNEHCPVPLYDDGQKDRRFVIGHMSPRYVGDEAFWDSVYHPTSGLFTPFAARAIADWLRGLDISAFKVRVLPKSKHADEHDAERGALHTYIDDGWRTDDGWRSTKEVLDAARSFCRERGIQPDGRMHDTLTMGKALAQFVTQGILEKEVRRSRVSFYCKVGPTEEQAEEEERAGDGVEQDLPPSFFCDNDE